jgi:hypothetical protein
MLVTLFCGQFLQVPGVPVRRYHQVTGVIRKTVQHDIIFLTPKKDVVLFVFVFRGLIAKNAPFGLFTLNVLDAPRRPDIFHAGSP